MITQKAITQSDCLEKEPPYSLVSTNGYYYYFYMCVDNRLRYSTGVKIEDTLPPTKQNIIEEKQKKIHDIGLALKIYLDKYELNGEAVLHDELKSYLDKKCKSAKIDKKKVRQAWQTLRIAEATKNRNFINDHKHWIELMRRGEITKKDGGILSKNSIDQYERMRKRWEACSKATKNDSENRFHLSYNMTIDDCQKMLIWLNKEIYSKNSIYDIFNNLKIFLKWSHKKGYHNNEMYKTMQESINVRPEVADAIAPSYEEILALYKKAFDNPIEERARDFFVLGCFLGLRVNDLRSINDYHLIKHSDGYYYFEVFTQKGQKTVQIPAHWIAREIYTKYKDEQKLCEYEPAITDRWEKHKDQKYEKGFRKRWEVNFVRGLIPVYSKNNLAQYLPRLCKEMITGRKLITITKGGVKQHHHYERWELITPHTMRRFFATFMYCDMDLSAAEVMEFTGHKTEESFFRYIKIDRQRTVKKVANLVAFLGPVESSLNLSVVA